MNELRVTTPTVPGLLTITDRGGEVAIELTADDATDLNNGLSITTLTTQGEEVALLPND